MSETNAQLIARLMRETADLIEKGLITEYSVHVEFGHRTEPDPRTGGFTMRQINTGERTVIIRLRGHDLQKANWESATGQSAIGTDSRFLPRL